MDRRAHPTSWEYGHTTSTPDETMSVCDISPCSPSTIGRSPSSPRPSQQRQQCNRQRTEITSGPVETRLADSPIPNRMSLMSRKLVSIPPTFPIISDQRAGPDRGLTRHQAPRLFHLPIVHAHHLPTSKWCSSVTCAPRNVRDRPPCPTHCAALRRSPFALVT